MRIKWPNDIYAGKLKIGGILCQSAYRNHEFQVVIGLGLNVRNRQPTTCVDAVIEEQHSRLGLRGAPSPVQPEVGISTHELYTLYLAAF